MFRSSVRRSAPRVVPMALAFAALLAVSPHASAQEQPERSGFTLLLNLGVGLQDDGALPESEVGLAGLNLGIGGFLNERMALWLRASGTNVSYDTPFGDVTQTSGFVGPALQYWTSDRFAVEGGVGVGFWDIEGENEGGLGLLLGLTYVFWTNGGHNLSLGAEYAPAFTDPETVHNYGLVFGWQLN
ncbi:MAG: hypothetical protein R3253_08635 [Longimicrobiales bacterium]|nr:hypothetical protein [Longimicrobiales bacterium]